MYLLHKVSCTHLKLHYSNELLNIKYKGFRKKSHLIVNIATTHMLAVDINNMIKLMAKYFFRYLKTSKKAELYETATVFLFKLFYYI
jgi:hypothetical protein